MTPDRLPQSPREADGRTGGRPTGVIAGLLLAAAVALPGAAVAADPDAGAAAPAAATAEPADGESGAGRDGSTDPETDALVERLHRQLDELNRDLAEVTERAGRELEEELSRDDGVLHGFIDKLSQGAEAMAETGSDAWEAGKRALRDALGRLLESPEESETQPTRPPELQET